MFVDDDNPKTPIVLHFPLVNDTFQKYKAPGKEAMAWKAILIILWVY